MSFRKALTNKENYIWILPLVGLIYQLILISVYSVNIPYFDEWDHIGSESLVSFPEIDWLYSQHNEHRIIPTKIIMWGLYKFNGWSHILSLYINLFIYSILVLSLVSFAKKTLKERFWVTAIAACLMFSPLNFENHLWGFQSQFHFSLLFQILAVIFATHERITFKNSFFAGIFSLLATYSMSLGTAMQLPCLILINLLWLYFEKYNGFKKLLPYNLITICGLILWFSYYRKPAHHPDLAFPWSVNFWNYFLNLVSFGHGFNDFNLWIGALILLLISIPIIKIIFYKQEAYVYGWGIITVSTLAALASISLGRANLGIDGSKVSRYIEIGMVCMFSAQVLWLKVFNKYNLLLVSLITSIALIGFSNDWDPAAYIHVHQERLKSVQCLKDNLNSQANFKCPNLYHSDLSKKLKFAVDNKFNFTEELTEAD